MIIWKYNMISFGGRDSFLFLPFLIGAFLLYSVDSYGRIVYVSSSEGIDSNTGISAECPMRSVSKALLLGDTLLLRAGDTFYESIKFSRGTISRYGNGPNPIISGMKRPTSKQWERVGDNIWRICLTSVFFSGYITGSSILNNIGCIYDYEEDIIYGKKVQFKELLINDWDFWQTSSYSNPDPKEFDFLYLCLSKNPNNLSLEFSVGDIALRVTSSTISNINIFGFGFGISAGSNCKISNCKIDVIGGMIHIGAPSFVCYGNGIEFYVSSSISNSIVEDCLISRCYDCALTIQGSRHDGAKPSNIVFKNNMIVGCCQGWEDFLNNGDFINYDKCILYNNVFIYRETGFGYPSTSVRYCHVLGNNVTGERGMIIDSNIMIGGNYYRSGAYLGRYHSNRWYNNKFYTTSQHYLLCNYLGTKDFLPLPNSKREAKTVINNYREKTGDSTTNIHLYTSSRIEKIAKRYIKRYLKKHSY